MTETPRPGDSDVNGDNVLLEETALQPTTDNSARAENNAKDRVTDIMCGEQLGDITPQKLDSAKDILENDEHKLDNARETPDNEQKVENARETPDIDQKVDNARETPDIEQKVDSVGENVKSETGLKVEKISSEDIQEQQDAEAASLGALSANRQPGQGLETIEQENKHEVFSNQTSCGTSAGGDDIESSESPAYSAQLDGTEVSDRLPPSRQHDYEDAVSQVSELKDVPSTDGDSIQTMEVQPRAETPQDCGVQKICDLASDENKLDMYSDEDIDEVPLLMEEVRLKDGEDSGDENSTEDRLKSTREIDQEKLEGGTDQTQHKSDGQPVLNISDDASPRDATDEVLFDQQEELKTQIKALQERLEIVIKDNQEKSMKIVTLEGELLEMTAKLRETERKVSTPETPTSRPDISKSKTCTVL